jgi:hypothetical protein
MKKLIWSRIKKMHCPKCNGILLAGPLVTGCVNCEFSMSKNSFEKIVKSLYAGHKIEPQEDNLTALNNL